MTPKQPRIALHLTEQLKDAIGGAASRKEVSKDVSNRRLEFEMGRTSYGPCCFVGLIHGLTRSPVRNRRILFAVPLVGRVCSPSDLSAFRGGCTTIPQNLRGLRKSSARVEYLM